MPEAETKAVPSFSDEEHVCIPLEVAERITPTDVKVLGELSNSDLTVSEVAERTGIDKSNISKSSKRLEGLDLLIREKESGKYGETKLRSLVN